MEFLSSQESKPLEYHQNFRRVIDNSGEAEIYLHVPEIHQKNLESDEKYLSDPFCNKIRINNHYSPWDNSRSRIAGIPNSHSVNEPYFNYQRAPNFFKPFYTEKDIMQTRTPSPIRFISIPPRKYELPIPQIKNPEIEKKTYQKSQLQKLQEQKKKQKLLRLEKRLDKFIETGRERWKQEPDDYYPKIESQQKQPEPQEKKEIEKYQNPSELNKKQIPYMNEKKQKQLTVNHHNFMIQTNNSSEYIHLEKTEIKDKILNKDFVIRLSALTIDELLKIYNQVKPEKRINKNNDVFIKVRLYPVKHKKVKLKLAENQK
jgi:hypothetical protein